MPGHHRRDCLGGAAGPKSGAELVPTDADDDQIAASDAVPRRLDSSGYLRGLVSGGVGFNAAEVVWRAAPPSGGAVVAERLIQQSRRE